MKRRIAILSGFTLLVVLAAWLTSPATLVATGERFSDRPLLLGVVLLVFVLVRPFLAIPTTLVAVVVGYVYSWAGVPFGVILLTITAIPPYALASAGRSKGLGFRTGERFVAGVGQTRSVVASRLLPAPSDAISVAAGVSGVRPRPFVVGTALGETPWVVAGVAVGISADRVLAEGLAVVDWTLVVGMVAAAALLLAGPCYRAYRARTGGILAR